MAMTTACCAAALCVQSYQPVSSSAASDLALEYGEIVVSTVNDIRVSYGLSEVSIVPVLTDAANVRAEELADTFSHTRPDGTSCFTILKEMGIGYDFIAENIAAGRADPVATVDQWMASEGHRENILTADVTHIGIGYYYDANSTYTHHWSMFLLTDMDGSAPAVLDGQYIPVRELGDVNGTKEVNANDASLVLKYSATLAAGIDYAVTEAFGDAGDVNSDSAIDANDASIILSYASAVGSGQDAAIEDFIW